MKNRILKFSLAVFSMAIFGCNEVTSFQPLEIDNNYNSLSKKNSKKRDNWFEGLSPELQAYYADAKDKTGMELFDTLHKIISQNTNADSYTSSRAYMFAIIDNVTVNEQTGVIDAYSGVFVPGAGENSEGYKENGDESKDGVSGDNINAEHTWPQSFFGKSLPMVSDIHALQTTLSTPNVMRRDFPFGEVTQNIVYSTACGSKLSVIDSKGKKVTAKALKQEFLKLKDPTPTPLEYRGVFEPCDIQKGNTARAAMYFYLRYFDMYIRQGSFESNNFWISRVPSFIKWSEQVDPVNDIDRKRNEDIFKRQGNRNPFIDIPNLASIIGEDVLKAKEASRKR